MTDPDAGSLRALVNQYGLSQVLRELWRIVKAWTEADKSYLPVRKCLTVTIRHEQGVHHARRAQKLLKAACQGNSPSQVCHPSVVRRGVVGDSQVASPKGI